ncbi:hypothetical protein BN10_630013 [Phycicoccus elongatus Lp2]|uniref:Uncharacterized protein n=1 Tax=Phycicoccus elongatus Lp2 TaxID=1193181 RepID=N0E5S8_9MICO|nr:hypothetical protein BN10_630013 [Phycicoccus elongatus Lp2]
MAGADVMVSLASGAVAQLVARLVRNEKARGSNPLSSTNRKSRLPSALFVSMLLGGLTPPNVRRVDGIPTTLTDASRSGPAQRPASGRHTNHGAGRKG